MPWHVYIIECRDHTLYTGITNNLPRRLKAHNSGNGGRYTKYRWPVKLIYSEEHPTKSEAQKPTLRDLREKRSCNCVESEALRLDPPRRRRRVEAGSRGIFPFRVTWSTTLSQKPFIPLEKFL